MAKKRTGKSSNRLGDTAESFGHVLGVLTSKVEQVNKQRAEVSKEILGFVKSAQNMLSDLGHRAELRIPNGRKMLNSAMAAVGRPGRKSGYKVSAAARRKMSLAAKRRWAAKRAGEKA